MAVRRFAADVSRNLARQGDDEVFAGVESRAVDTEVNSVVSVASSADRSESTTHGGELRTSYVLRSERLGFWSGRQMTRDLLDVDPVPDAVPAYLHGSQVEYYSCTHQRWLRGVMTLDALDHRVEGYDLGGGLRFPGFSETFDRTIELPRGQTAQISSTWSTCISVSGDCCVAPFPCNVQSHMFVETL